MPYLPKMLVGNLIEIHTALQQETMEIVPAPIGKKLYYSGSGWGKIWKIFFIVWGALFGKRFKLKKLKQAIDRTETLFNEYLKKTENRLNKFEKYLVDLIEEQKVFSKKKFDKYRWSITEWSHSTRPFYKAIKQRHVHEFNMFMHSLPFNGIANTFSIPEDTYKKLRQYDRLIAIEKHLDKETPYPILKKLSQIKTLSDEEEGVLKVWIKRINDQKKQQIPVSKFHKGLQVLVQHIQEKHCTVYQELPNLSQLEMELADRGLKIFNNPDGKHCKWRKGLKPNHQFTWLKEIKDKNFSSAKIITLGEEILSSKRKSNNLVFSIVNDPAHVVIIGKNKAILGIKDLIAKNRSGGVHYAKWLFVDPQGEFAILEKLNPFFSAEKKWFSEKTLDKRDQLAIHPVINQIKWFIKYQKTPMGLSFAELMYDKAGFLKSTKPKLLQSFNFPLIVNFALECSKNNPVVFKYIMKASGLLEHKYVKYYHEILVKTLSEENIIPSDIAASLEFRITDPVVIEQAENFNKEIVQIIDSTMRKLNRKYENVELIPTVEYIKKQLLLMYNADQTVCLFWPTIKKRLRERAVKQFKLTNLML